MDYSVLPTDWLTSNISVIHKKGSKSSLENYRPISLTSIPCKIMETLVRDHILDHFLTNQLLSSSQYGFIKGRSATLQLLKVIDAWTSALDSGQEVAVVYTDFAKAFDKIPHRRLLTKLEGYGVSEKVISWIQTFLTTRTQQVKINNCISNTLPVRSGIPQGTVLGPLLFIIYVNDLPEVCKFLCSIFLFADDAKLYKEIGRYSDFDTLASAFHNFLVWCDKWCLKLNVSKCKVLSICSRSGSNYDFKFDIPYNNGSVHLDFVDNFKDLGVTIDSNLSFKEHIINKTNKAFAMLGIIRRTFDNIGKDIFLLLYKSLVRSHLEYGHSIWNPHHMGLIREIESVQKRATKLVPACRKLTYKERLRFLQLPTLRYRRIRGDMLEVYKIVYGLYDPMISPHLPRNLDSRTRGNSMKLLHVRSKLDVRKFAFSNRIVSIWNALPDWVVLSGSLDIFKINLDKFWFDKDIYFNFEAELAV